MEPHSPESDTTPNPPDGEEAADVRTSPRTLVRFAWGFAGIILPAICFAIGYPDQPNWQSGSVGTYAKLLMSREASLPLYPLLLYSIVCLAMLTGRPAHYAKSGWIWLGVFSGAVVAVEYWSLFVAATTNESAQLPLSYVLALFLSAFAVAVPWFAARVIVFAVVQLAEPRKNGLVMLVQIAVAIGLLILILFGFPYVAVLCLFCSTLWAVAAYASAAVWLVRQRGKPYFRYTLAQLLAATTALAANFAAWRTAYQIMLTEYARLPTVPPQDCFVCSAAARGHSFVVRSDAYRGLGRQKFLVNDQLRILKAFELLLLSLSPVTHSALRKVYNRVGPRLAASLVHPLAADAAYFVLKPFEWFARFVLRLVLGKRTALIARLYRV
jgi:hypothetical protein